VRWSGSASRWPSSCRSSGLPGIPPAYGVAGVATPGYGGLLVGPPLIGFVAEHAGLWSGFLMLALLGAMLAVGGYLVARRRGED
jgi:hypothetical protein